MIQKIINFLNAHNYDVRISKNARWIDQKCTPDVISIIADCILEYTNHNTEIEFSTKYASFVLSIVTLNCESSRTILSFDKSIV